MKRRKFKRDWKLAWRPWYVASKKFDGAGLKDANGRTYVVEPEGFLRRIGPKISNHTLA